jgi:hypothetical protein
MWQEYDQEQILSNKIPHSIKLKTFFTTWLFFHSNYNIKNCGQYRGDFEANNWSITLMIA